MSDLAARAEALRALHHAPRPLVLPNCWDVATARAVVEAGFPVVATSSSAVADALGYADDDVMPPDLVFAVIGRIAARVDVPVTADLEAGYGLPAGQLVDRLLAAGAAGCNLEDTDHHGRNVLVSVAGQADRLRALRRAGESAGVPLVINARIDVFIREVGSPESRLPEAIERARAYLAAGADCVYPIGLSDAGAIEAFVRAVAAPVNIWLRPDAPPLHELARLGVARVSLATGLFNRAMAAVQTALTELQASTAGLPIET